MSMSPRTQAMAAPGSSGDQAKALFERGLSDMAYNVLVNKLPNISPDVVTFKILDSDAEKGAGVGAFVVIRRNQTVYIPVVMAENQIKPLDIMYYKAMNVFLPLDKAWLEELDKLSLGELGTSVSAPTTLNTDVDIRNTVVPPSTGRYSYASAVAGVEIMLDEIRNQQEPKLAFLDFMSRAPNVVKKAAARLFETSPKLLKQAVYFYGERPFIDALTLRTEKVAGDGGKMSPTGALYIADTSTKADDYKSLFGPDAGAAYGGVRLKGYFAKDTRKGLKRALQVHPYLELQEPRTSGAYRLWKSDGKPVVALVVGNPVDLFNGAGRRVPARNVRFRPAALAPAIPMEGAGARYRVPGADGTTNGERPFVQRYLAITENGQLVDAEHMIGQEVTLADLEGSAVFRKAVADGNSAGPRKGQRGVFIQRRGGAFQMTTPVEIERVTDLADGVRRIEVSSGTRRKVIVVEKHPGKLLVPEASDTIYMPADYSWFPVKAEMGESEILTSPEQIMKWSVQGLLDNGAEKITVKMSSHGFMFGPSPREAFSYVPALRKLATDASICVEDAEAALKLASEKGRFEFWVVPEAQFAKVAAYLKVAAGEDASGGGEPAAQDPAEAAMMGVQGAPMAPAAPNPVDMAVAEAMQNIMAQQTALAAQQALVQQIQQRTNMIAAGGGAMGAPAAAAAAMGGPMDPSMMGAGAAPMQPGAAPMQPGAPQAAPQPGAQSGMAMQQGGGPQAAMSPMQQGMDPAAQQQPPPAMMNSEDGSVEGVMSQVNPQFLEQAGNLNDAGTFDAAALSSMAQTPALKDLVGAYVPNLEKSLDNIGRVLLSLWMDEGQIKEDLGAETYINLEDNLRTVFRGLGDLVLKINQNTSVLRGPHDMSPLEA